MGNKRTHDGTRGRTVIHNRKTGETFVGSFDADHDGTAHSQLAEQAGLSEDDLRSCVGASIQHDADGYFLSPNSETINKNNDLQSDCVAHGNSLNPIVDNLNNGNYTTVSQNGSINEGQRMWDVEKE